MASGRESVPCTVVFAIATFSRNNGVYSSIDSVGLWKWVLLEVVDEIEGRRRQAELCAGGRDLPAMMGAMVDNVHEYGAHVRLGDHRASALIRERTAQVDIVRKPFDEFQDGRRRYSDCIRYTVPAWDVVLPVDALVVGFGVQDGVRAIPVRQDAFVLVDALEPRQPQLIGQDEMVQRPVDRPEAQARMPMVLVVRQRLQRSQQPIGRPDVVPRVAPNRIQQAHGQRPNGGDTGGTSSPPPITLSFGRTVTISDNEVCRNGTPGPDR